MSSRIDIIITENVVVDATQTVVRSITDIVTAFNYTMRAYGGFATAQVMITCDEVTAYQMLNDHIGRRIVFQNPLSPDSDWEVWEGMIYTVTVDDGNTSTSRSLQDVFNSVRVQYSSIDTTVTPPILGIQALTAASADTTSSGKYGVRQLVRNTGGSTSVLATALAAQILKDYKNPRATSAGATLGVTSPGVLAVRIECIGFMEQLNHRYYSNAATSSVTLDTIIKAVLTSVSQFANTDQTNILANTYTRGQYQADATIDARTYIDLLCSLGDGATARRVFYGFYEQRKFYTTVESTTADYYIKKRDSGYRCYDAVNGGEVMPWLIRPGKIASMIDLLPDGVTYSTTLDDVRQFVIGEVSFTAPFTARITPLQGVASDILFNRMGNTQIGKAYDVIITGAGDRSTIASGVLGTPGVKGYIQTGMGQDVVTGGASQPVYGDNYISQQQAQSEVSDRLAQVAANSAAAAKEAAAAVPRARTDAEWSRLSAAIQYLNTNGTVKTDSGNINDWIARSNQVRTDYDVSEQIQELYRNFGVGARPGQKVPM